MLLAGRLSRAGGVRPSSKSPQLPVSTAVKAPAGTPVPPGDSDDDDIGSDAAAGWHSPAGATTESSDTVYERTIELLTSVWRAGLAGADTDHTRCGRQRASHNSSPKSRMAQGARVLPHARCCWLAALRPPPRARSICYPVGDDGELGPGVTATHWYRLGAANMLRVPASAHHTWEEHPESGYLVAGGAVRPGSQLLAPLLPGTASGLTAAAIQPSACPAGHVIPDWCQSVTGLALQAHALLAPDVPLIGWDIALPADPEGAVLLELNISCNCFNGRYDRCGLWVLWHSACGRAQAPISRRPGCPAARLQTLRWSAYCMRFCPRSTHLVSTPIPCTLQRRRAGYYDLMYAYFAELQRAGRERAAWKVPRRSQRAA